MRTSRSASWTLASVSRASPRSVLMTRDRRPVRLSNTGNGWGWCRLRKVAEILPYLINALLYGALAFYCWRTRWGPAGNAPDGRRFLQRLRALRRARAARPARMAAGRRDVCAGRAASRRRQRGLGDPVAHGADLLARQLPLPARRPAVAGDAGRGGGGVPAGGVAVAEAPAQHRTGGVQDPPADCDGSPTACSPSRRCTCC